MAVRSFRRAVLFSLLAMAGRVWAQDPEWMERTSPAPVAGPGEVVWKNQFTFYGDNTEFFEPFRVRETILGQQFESYVDASASGQADLWSGLFLDHPSAQEVETNVQPILSFVYHSGASQFIFGTLQPFYRHGLIEPMEVTTLELTRPIEYGLEWVQKDPFINFDAFLNWQQLLTDVQREIFDYGGSGQLPLASDIAVEVQCHGYHVGGANTDGLVRNNLAGGLGLAFKPRLPVLGSSSLEIFGLGSKDSNRPDYPGPTYGRGLYTKVIVSPDDRWQFFGLSWIGQDYMSEEGDSNYNSLGADGVYYQSNRTYEELGVRRFVAIENGVTFDFELRSHWIEDVWANSFRIQAFIPFDVGIDLRKKNAMVDNMGDSSLETKTKIAFTTLGCRVNQYDTQAMKEQVERADFQTVPFDEPSDIYVINTCTVTAAADAEGRQLVRRAKAKNPDSFVVVTGCLAQDRPGEVAALPGVNLIVGNNEKSNLLNRILQSHPVAIPNLSTFTPSPIESSPWGEGISRFDGHQRATLKVQDGCNFGCSFCLIPRVRGAMISRPCLEIVEEGKRLAANGIKELVLAGIQLSSYGRDWGMKPEEPRLAPVIEKLLAIPGIQRVRLSSYAVVDFEEALLSLWKSGPGLCAHLHLPLQSGDEGILKSMRRPYTLDRYRQTVEKVRDSAPQVGLTSDIIAGFPGETEEAFENTLLRIREFDFVDFHPFPYSDRPDTPGEKMTPKVHPAVIRERMNRLWGLKKECLNRSAERAQGREYRVIVERHSREQQAGLTDEGLRVFFPRKEEWLGKETRVRTTGARAGAAQAEWA